MRELEDLLGYRFRNRELLNCALTHRSTLGDRLAPEEIVNHNERMEFLGDALLGALVSQFLYQAYPLASEGDLSTIRGRLVSKKALARIAESIRLGDFLKLGKGEELSKGRKKTSILVGALEALIAALYLDGGWHALSRFLFPHIGGALGSAQLPAGLDPKSKLQALVQSYFHVLPQYRIRTKRGPSHDPIFWVEVRVGQKALGMGKGRSKKEAEQEAARAALVGWQGVNGR
jgi:ribonuclease-3